MYVKFDGRLRQVDITIMNPFSDFYQRCCFLCSDDNPTPWLNKHERVCCGAVCLVFVTFGLLAFFFWFWITILSPVLGFLFASMARPLVHCDTTVAMLDIIRQCVYDTGHCQCMPEGMLMLFICLSLCFFVCFVVGCGFRLRRSWYSLTEIEKLQKYESVMMADDSQ